MNDLKALLKSNKFRNNQSVRVVTFLRIVIPATILINPLWGFVANCVIDFTDAFFVKHRGGFTWTEYHLWDKAFDWVSYFFMMVSGIIYGYGLILFLWLAFRLIGQSLFLKNKKTWYFLVFPNIFEFMFVWYVIIIGFLRINVSGLPFLVWFSALVVLKEAQEIWLHYYWPRHLKAKGYPTFMHKFGYEKVFQ